MGPQTGRQGIAAHRLLFRGSSAFHKPRTHSRSTNLNSIRWTFGMPFLCLICALFEHHSDENSVNDRQTVHL